MIVVKDVLGSPDLDGVGLDTDALRQALELAEARPHGDAARWQAALARLPVRHNVDVDLDCAAVRIGRGADLDDATKFELESTLRELQPWRKGPFSIYGIDLDTEWRSDWKWARVLPHLDDLSERRVLDVGCGNGYHVLRMGGEGAAFVLGVDPMALFTAQFNALRTLMGDYEPATRLHVLPLPFESLPEVHVGFDTVFSMGVLYHRRSPFEHLKRLREALRPGGQLVLETLVVDGDEQTVLTPKGRYARMRNVWMIPAPQALARWLERCGFKQVRVVDRTPTTVAEQRTTEWMPFESLAQALESGDSSRTVEGEPAPVRAVVIAEK